MTAGGAALAARLGARLVVGGVEFGFWSPQATRVELLLFERRDDLEPTRSVVMGSTGDGLWTTRLEGAGPGLLYGFRAHGPEELGFEPAKLLLDPCARVLVPSGRPAREAASHAGSNLATAPKALTVDLTAYDWQGDTPLAGARPVAECVVYEAHLRGFTRHPSSGVEAGLAGTYRGFIERIPHLVQLGVNVVELLPVQAFDAEDAPPGLTNHWGYSQLAWYAPHPAYAAGPAGAELDEFRDLVRALHAAGIEVWLDVVFNHTAEGNADGPTYHFRRSAAQEAYVHSDDGTWFDATGCGNTVSANDPVMTGIIVECLAHWVSELHVDGFRFDLAAALTRGVDGEPLSAPPLLAAIAAEPRLASTRLVAEAWDTGGLYQVGSFPAEGWLDWNDRHRDDLRRYLIGEPDSLAPLLTRLEGSPDVYPPGRTGIAYVTCHDGFTLNDLVSYEDKHNHANLEGGRDGTTNNYSSNHGVEGPSDDPGVEALRELQMRNGLCLTLLAPGPVLLNMGDELRRTQTGNNNAYCHDSELSWLDWSLADRHADLVAFVARVIRLRGPAREREYVRHLVDEAEGTAVLEESSSEGRRLVLLNRSAEERSLVLPAGQWTVLVTTEDPVAGGLLEGEVQRPGRSVALLSARELDP